MHTPAERCTGRLGNPRGWIRRSGMRWILWPAALILAVLLFSGGPSYHSPRSVSATCDLGHVLAFCLWSFLLHSRAPVAGLSPARKWTAILLFCLVAGGGTEWVQSLLGEDASIGDLLRDVLGGLLALAWFIPPTEHLPSAVRRTAKGLSISLLLIALVPLAAAVSDEVAARVQFPLLSDFETPFEKDRWEEQGGRFSVDRSVARHGNASLRLDLGTSLYSGISLVHFPGKWAGYRSLRLSVFNPEPREVAITVRIHDRLHEEGEMRYEDRFQQEFAVRAGWNDLRIDLGEVARAPDGRRMDLDAIRGVGLFATRLPAPRTLFLDFVRLE